MAYKLWLLPLFTCIWFLATFMISYAIAVSLEHVKAIWPYISDTGTTPPESCYFGQMLNIGALLMGLIYYCQYNHQKLKIVQLGSGSFSKILNGFTCFAGYVSAFGISMVANFQETSVLQMHLVGAMMCFGVGAGYNVFQTLLCSLLNNGDRKGFRINIIRSILCITHIVTFATTMIYGGLAGRKKEEEEEMIRLNPTFENYGYHIASTTSEWILAICIGLYLVTFCYEFTNLDYSLKFKKKNNHTNEMDRA